MNLYLIRHPKPDVVTGTCYGSMDIELESGWQQDAEQLSSWLFSRLSGNSKSYHSPLVRAASLAQFLIPDSVEHHSLSELDFGDWEGHLWSDIPQEEIDVWAQDIVHENPYNGESLKTVNNRVMTWWEERVIDFKNLGNLPNNIVVVTHSGVIKVLVSQLCGWPLAQSHFINPDFLSVTELSISINTAASNNQNSQQANFVSLKRLGAGDWI